MIHFVDSICGVSAAKQGESQVYVQNVEDDRTMSDDIQSNNVPVATGIQQSPER